jgi:hypothetical protein
VPQLSFPLLPAVIRSVGAELLFKHIVRDDSLSDKA